MKQAKTLTAQELRRVLDYLATRPQAARNRAILLSGHLSGMRVGEIARLKIGDVLDASGKVKPEIYLAACQTKGKQGRTVLVSEKLNKELTAYAKTLTTKESSYAFFPTQKQPKRGFTPNTLAQHLMYIYRRAGIDGASSLVDAGGFLKSRFFTCEDTDAARDKTSNGQHCTGRTCHT